MDTRICKLPGNAEIGITGLMGCASAGVLWQSHDSHLLHTHLLELDSGSLSLRLMSAHGHSNLKS